jgi:formate hydrogenlyase subunit 4
VNTWHEIARNAGIVVAALLVAPLVGALVFGLDRKITARMQGRVGPPLLQPVYDIVKLLGKEPLFVNRVQILYAILHLAFILVVIVLLLTGQDLLMALFAHVFSGVALILGGLSVRSPYSRIGSHRKIMQMLAYEPVMVLLVVGTYLCTGGFLSSDVTRYGHPLLFQMPLVFVAYVAASVIKLEKSPFDVATSHHAHQEIVKGVTTEYSGPYLAIIELANMCEISLVVLVMASFWASNWIAGALLAAACYFAILVVDNITARLTTLWMVRYMWTMPLLLATGNVIWLYP